MRATGERGKEERYREQQETTVRKHFKITFNNKLTNIQLDQIINNSSNNNNTNNNTHNSKNNNSNNNNNYDNNNNVIPHR